MPALPGHKMVGTYVPAERFEAWAWPDGGKAVTLRRLITTAIEGEPEGLHRARLGRSALIPVGDR
ncbi:hypothetical protein MyNCGM152_10190 [Achromobacter xylosoxidans]